jgi:glycosyltransferase involved in cell wall biosynthesis
MQILWISHFLLFPETGYGGLQRSRNLLKVLSKYHDIHLVCFYRNNDKIFVPDIKLAERDLKNYCKNVYIIPNELSNTQKAFHLLKSVVTRTPYSVYIYRSRRLLKESWKLISDKSIDLIHSDTIGMIEPILNRINIIKVLTHHDVESHKMHRRYENEENPLKRIFFLQEYMALRRYEKKYCVIYDSNIAVSDMDKNRLQEIDERIKVNVIQNGVDCEYFKYYPRDEMSRELIFTGALDYYPNAKAMLYFCGKMWPILKSKYTELKLTIIGKNPPAQLQSFGRDGNDINILGYVEDIRPHMMRAKVFICPIMEGGGTRIKILDAFSQGIPVVSTIVGAEGLDLQKGKHILLADTVTEFVDGVSDLLENEELSKSMSLCARKFVEENYSYNIIGKKMATVYNEMVEKNVR